MGLLCQFIRSGFMFGTLEDSSNLHSVTFIRPRNLQDFLQQLSAGLAKTPDLYLDILEIKCTEIL